MGLFGKKEMFDEFDALLEVAGEQAVLSARLAERVIDLEKRVRILEGNPDSETMERLEKGVAEVREATDQFIKDFHG